MQACTDQGAWALALSLHLLGIVADPGRIQHEAGRSDALEVDDLLRATARFPVKAKLVSSKIARLKSTPLPTLAVLKDGGFVVIGKVTETGVLIQGLNDAGPRLLTFSEFETIWSGQLILIAKRAELSDTARRFNFSWFAAAIGKYRRILIEVLLASFVIQLFGLATPMIFQVVIDKVLVHRGLSTLEVMVAGLALIALFEAVLSGLRTYLFTHTSNRIDVELGARLFRHLMRLPLAYFESRRVGDSVARVRELETIRQFITSSSITLVLDLAFAAVFIGVMFLYSSTLAWIVCATLPVYALLSLATTPAFRTRLDEKFRRGAENQAFLVESVTGVETIKAMAVEPLMQRRWEEQLASYVGASFSASQIGNWASQAASLLNKGVGALTLFVGAGLVIANRMTVGELVAFNMLANQVSGPVLRLVQVWQDFHQVRLSVERLGDILNTPVEAQSGGAEQNLPPLDGAIEFERVTFRYGLNTQPVLREVSLRIGAGQVVGIVGPSGSGKSTIAKLAQRLYQPEAGRVLVDGIDTAVLDPSWLRRQIGVVLQENVLFNRSVRDNIALADPALSMERIVEAAKLAGAHEFICRMPQGYDTVIGERGVSLSGGQRQRIAIARALVGDPRILIFDEATSALDYESESIIQANMRDIVRGRTVLIIAHRLSTVRSADRILTIENGVIVQDGTHEQLVAGDGRYATLHRIQSAGL
ncbi:Toxin secretion ABC transporter (ATP-binding and membrane protein); hlyB-like protein [Bradyrhizobium sp. ORS 285]|uniref:type I secretion system permease/ATPase n=1 Tax=Bradyrhizobium sp. ORS 285 TaxID=115808 RepID=UPI0002408A60|nr:type I secretion system permease/ATPase [Bradyrhizobium sp. ORS 285]CCD89172.1 Toxin secretion ABC transporter (ATP-binding and membrane protein); hlyB-like protein [Bradyrhizobium sp. ORS 285]SMX59427.1 Toxin secretion ABC transporter (ATP-binding and membrane protein); hlyB-like protein [Bradyrhizobium sp. ORS 285]